MTRGSPDYVGTTPGWMISILSGLTGLDCLRAWGTHLRAKVSAFVRLRRDRALKRPHSERFANARRPEVVNRQDICLSRKEVRATLRRLLQLIRALRASLKVDGTTRVTLVAERSKQLSSNVLNRNSTLFGLKNDFKINFRLDSLCPTGPGKILTKTIMKMLNIKHRCGPGGRPPLPNRSAFVRLRRDDQKQLNGPDGRCLFSLIGGGL